MTFEICSQKGNVFYTRCNCNIPLVLCAIGNIAGHFSTVIWFLVLVPQTIRNFRHKSVEGISVTWAILNFTAALNNAFFIFLLGNMPWYTYVSAIYMPLLEATLLIQFVLYGTMTRMSYVVVALCFIVWITIIILQMFFNISGELEWISIALWSFETIPQIFLNLQRRSTYGLSNLSVAITTVGKITDFMENYLLVMPLQYVVMAFFSSSIAELGTAQVIWYYNQRPQKDANGYEKRDELIRKPIRRSCNILRFLGLGFFTLLLTTFAVAFIIRTAAFESIIAPIALYLLFIGYFEYLQYSRSRKGQKDSKEGKEGSGKNEDLKTSSKNKSKKQKLEVCTIANSGQYNGNLDSVN